MFQTLTLLLLVQICFSTKPNAKVTDDGFEISAKQRQNDPVDGSSLDLQYKYHIGPKNWHDAEAACKQNSASLAVEYSVDIRNEIITNFGSAASFWIGVYSNDNGQTWKSVNGQSVPIKNDQAAVGELPAFWGAGEPNNLGGDQYCVHDSFTGGSYKEKWDDLQCSVGLPYLCQKFVAHHSGN